MIAILILLIFFVMEQLRQLRKDINPEEEICDYDSCSQKAVNLFDDRCFDSEDSKCQPFLEFWNKCQELKKEGEC